MSAFPRRPRLRTCRYCGEAFGTASLRIHEPRCLAQRAPEEAEDERGHPPVAIPSLYDLCSRAVSVHLAAMVEENRFAPFFASERAMARLQALPPPLLCKLLHQQSLATVTATRECREVQKQRDKLQRDLEAAGRLRAQAAALRRDKSTASAQLADARTRAERAERGRDAALKELREARRSGDLLKRKLAALQSRAGRAPAATIRRPASAAGVRARGPATTAAPAPAALEEGVP